MNDPGGKAVIVFCMLGIVLASMCFLVGWWLLRKIDGQPYVLQLLMNLALLLCLIGFALPTLCVGYAALMTLAEWIFGR